MRISFIIPAFNEEKLIERCLRSIEKQAKDSSVDCEIIVIDNASTDRTAIIAQSVPGVRVIQENRKGTGYARQAGFTISTGDLIATIDADTVLMRGWMNRAIQRFTEDPQLVGLSGPYYFYEVGWVIAIAVAFYYGIAYISHVIGHYIFHRSAVMIGGNAVMRRTAVEAIGGFNTDILFYGDDTDMAKRLSAIGKVLFDMRLIVESSPRRIEEEGLLRTGVRYMINHVWILLFKKPYHREHRDIRV